MKLSRRRLGKEYFLVDPQLFVIILLIRNGCRIVLGPVGTQGMDIGKELKVFLLFKQACNGGTNVIREGLAID